MIVCLFTGRCTLAAVLALIFIYVAPLHADENQLPIKPQQVSSINSLFKENGIVEGIVTVDQSRRIRLDGTYEDIRQVELAFAFAQAVVGVNRVSPVVPENIKVKAWERKVENIFKNFAIKALEKAPESGKPSTVPSKPIVAPTSVGRKYALVVGVSRFRESRIALKYARRDAEAIYDYLVGPKGGFIKDDVILLADENATKDNINKGLETIEERATADDLALVYFSSHGTPPYTNGVVHVVTYDTEVTNRMAAWSSSISGDRIGDFVKRTRAQRIVVILDTCYSSGAYRSVTGFQSVGGKSLDLYEENYGTPKGSLGKLVGAKDLVLDDDGEKAVPTDEKNAWGTVLLSASDSGEKSWESDSIQHSFFTYYLLQGLDRSGDVRNGFRYASPNVVGAVKREKDADQHPQVAANRVEWNIRVGK